MSDFQLLRLFQARKGRTSTMDRLIGTWPPPFPRELNPPDLIIVRVNALIPPEKEEEVIAKIADSVKAQLPTGTVVLPSYCEAFPVFSPQHNKFFANVDGRKIEISTANPNPNYRPPLGRHEGSDQNG